MNRTMKLTLSGLSAALIFAGTWFIRIPTALGYINAGDGLIILAGAWLGGVPGLVAGAVGSALADLAAGYAVYVPATAVIKGAVGLIAGLLLRGRTVKKGEGRPARAHGCKGGDCPQDGGDVRGLSAGYGRVAGERLGQAAAVPTGEEPLPPSAGKKTSPASAEGENIPEGVTERRARGGRPGPVRILLTALLCETVMTAGYFAFESLIYSPAGALGSLVPNILQGAAGMAIGFAGVSLLPKIRRAEKKEN